MSKGTKVWKKDSQTAIRVESLCQKKSCTKLEIDVLKVPAQSYPQVAFAQTHGREIMKDVPESARDLLNNIVNWDCDTVQICIANFGGYKPNYTLDNIQLRKSSNVTTKRVYPTNINTFISEKAITNCSLTIILVSVKEVNCFLDQIETERILENSIFVAENTEERDNFSSRIDPNNVALCVDRDLPTTICKLFERLVYHNFSEIVNTINREICQENQMEQSKDDTSRIRLLQRSVKRFAALFLRSNIPSFVYPDAVKKSTESSCQKANQVFDKLRKIEGIKCCAFSNGQLEVFVDSTCRNISSTKRNEDIRAILQQLNIQDFKIMLIKEHLYCTLESGSKIIASPPHQQFGTIGAVVNWRRIDGCIKKCAVTAQHVVSGSASLYWIRNETPIVIGNILPRQLPYQMGCLIGVAELIQPHDTGCNFMFKNRDGVTRKGRIADFETIAECLPVYLRGAQTELGIGLIKSLNATGPSGRNDLILVEDSTQEHPFCLPGDSGAIIFTDDPKDEFVDILGMLEGEYENRENLEESNRQYTALRIIEGFTELTNTFSGTFTFVNPEN